MLAACTGRGERMLPDRSGYPGRCRNGRYCAVSGGFTALNRITDVIRVASPRITQRLYAIAPKRSAAAKGNGTRGSSARCGGRLGAAGKSASRRPEFLAGAQPVAALAAGGVSAPPFGPRRATLLARPGPLSTAPAVVGAPWPRPRPHRPPAGPARQGRRLVAAGIFGRCRATSLARPGLLQRRAAPIAAPAPAHPTQRGGGLAPAALRRAPAHRRLCGGSWIKQRPPAR